MIRAWMQELDEIFGTGDYPYYLEKLKQYIEQADRECPEEYSGRCALYNELGAFLRNSRQGDYGEEAFLQGVKILEECRKQGVQNDSLTVNLATTINNLAGTYRVKKEYAPALENYDRAIALYQQDPGVPEDLYASALNNKGLVFLEMEQYAESVACFEEALVICGDSKYARATTYSNLGYVKAKNKDFEGALEAFRASIDSCGTDPVFEGLRDNSWAMIKKLEAL